jgi:hypothetical protein
MGLLKSLVSSTHIYLDSKSKLKEKPNTDLLVKVGGYISKMMRVFGVFKDSNPRIGSDSLIQQGMVILLCE